MHTQWTFWGRPPPSVPPRPIGSIEIMHGLLSVLINSRKHCAFNLKGCSALQLKIPGHRKPSVESRMVQHGGN